MDSSLAQRLWNVVHAVLYVLRKGISKRKLVIDLHLLLHRGKIAGKALGNLLTFHGHGHGHDIGNAAAAAATAASSFSCRSIDPNLAVYNPRRHEVEFSCSNTPSYPSFHLPKRHRRRHRRRDNDGYYSYNADDVAKVFEMLNDSDAADVESALSTALATPSPALWSSLGCSPAAPVRQLTITDSPFPVTDDAADGGQVDRAADEFIRRFYEQLRTQQSVAAATPDYYSAYGHGQPVAGRA